MARLNLTRRWLILTAQIFAFVGIPSFYLFRAIFLKNFFQFVFVVWSGGVGSFIYYWFKMREKPEIDALYSATLGLERNRYYRGIARSQAAFESDSHRFADEYLPERRTQREKPKIIQITPDCTHEPYKTAGFLFCNDCGRVIEENQP